MTIQKKPLGTLGVEITGVDVGRDLSGGNGDNLFGDIRQAWQEAGGLMVIRDQTIDQQQHIDFSRRFGPLFHDEGQPPLQDTVSRYLHPDHPQLYRVSNKVDAKGARPRPRSSTPSRFRPTAATPSSPTWRRPTRPCRTA